MRTQEEKEEEKLARLNKEEKAVRDAIPPGQPIESARKAVDMTSFPRWERKTDLIERILAEQGLSVDTRKKAAGEISGNARRSKRYYIRKRIQEGKPYIPRYIRSQGKKVALSLGYKKWEVRVIPEESLPEKEVDIKKLKVVFRIMNKDKMASFFQKKEKGEGDEN